MTRAVAIAIGILAVMVLADQAEFALTVTPRTGIAPLTVTARTRALHREPGERVLELIALEGDLVVRRSEIDLDALLEARPNDALSHRAEWTLPAGAYVVAACFQPTSRCRAASVDIR